MRLFVALDIPDSVRQSLAGLSARFRPICPDAGWVRLEGVHLTLKFIGEVPSENLNQIRVALEMAQARTTFEIRFRSLGFFPTPHRPRVFWAGIEAGDDLAALARAIEDRLEPLGIPRENREFNPHITLARFKSMQGMDRLRAAAAEFSETEFGRTTAHEFHLYQSVLKRSGAEYTRLATYAFSTECKR